VVIAGDAMIRALSGPRDGEIVPTMDIVATQDWRGYLFSFDTLGVLVSAEWRAYLARLTA
jgi:hypothetical protein